MSNKKTIFLAIVYFLLSAALAGIFIANKFWLYNNINAMIFSGTIAGGKWLLQIIAAYIFLKEKKWEFIKRIGFVCFIGSLILFVYYIFNFFPLPIDGFSQFIVSIGLSVLAMIMMYYRTVKKTGLSIKWFWGWMICLVIAISLQLNIVF